MTGARMRGALNASLIIFTNKKKRWTCDITRLILNTAGGEHTAALARREAGGEESPNTAGQDAG